MSDHTILVIWVMKIFFCIVLLCILATSFASLRSIPFLPFIVPIFAWNIPLVSLIFLKRSLVFPIPLFSSISLHWALRKAFLSLLATLWNSAFRWLYFSFSLLPFASLLYQLFVRPPKTTILPFCISFSLGMVLISASCTMLWTSAIVLLGLYQI